MANFRSFTLYSFDRKEKVDLNSFNGYLVSAPRGLGIYLNNKYLSLGNKRILTDQKNAFESLTLTIDIFGATRNAIEKKYCDLRDFIARNRAGGFLLSYLPYEGEYEGVAAQERYIECDIKVFDKSEKATSRYMAIPLTVEPRSFWKVDVQTFSTHAVLPREFEFAEDANVTNDIVISNAGGEYSGAQSDILITSSVPYDKSTLPSELKIEALSDDFRPSPIFINSTKPVRFTKEDFSLISGTKYRAEKYSVDRNKFEFGFYRQGVDVNFFCEFDIENEKFSAGVFFSRSTSSTLTEGVDYTIEHYQNGSCRIEFSDYYIDKECYIELKGTIPTDYPQPGTWSFPKTKNAGEKVVDYCIKDDYGESIQLTVDYISTNIRTEIDSFLGHYPSEYTWSINAEISKGKDNYFASLVEDSGISGYYCLPFGVGKSSAATIKNDGDNEVPALLKIYGEAINPFVILSKKSDGSTVQNTAINMTIPVNRYVEINSDPENTGAWLKGSALETPSVVNVLDIRTSMFITIPRGEFYIRAYDSSENPVVFSVAFGKEYFGA